MLKIQSEVLEKMVEHCRREYPNEACGYLAGSGDRIIRVFPIRNADASPTWYEMDGVEMIRAQKEMRQLGLKEMAVYHSHVATEAEPSARDIRRATEVQDMFGGHYVLVTLKEKDRPRARAFKIQDGHVTEEPLTEE